jgi:hypothetical protein
VSSKKYSPFIENRIRVRAYYLWHERTGKGWRDDVSNWLEAETLELEEIERRNRPIEHRAEWPFSLHTTFADAVVAAKAGQWSSKAILRWIGSARPVSEIRAHVPVQTRQNSRANWRQRPARKLSMRLRQPV